MGMTASIARMLRFSSSIALATVAVAGFADGHAAIPERAHVVGCDVPIASAISGIKSSADHPAPVIQASQTGQLSGKYAGQAGAASIPIEYGSSHSRDATPIFRPGSTANNPVAPIVPSNKVQSARIEYAAARGGSGAGERKSCK